MREEIQNEIRRLGLEDTKKADPSLAEGVRRRERGIFFSFEESRPQILTDAKTIGIAAPVRDDDNWGPSPGTNTSDDLQAIHIRQPQVQKNDIGIMGGRHGETLAAGGGLQQFKALALQGRLEEAANRHLIFDHQHEPIYPGHDLRFRKNFFRNP